MGVIKMRLDVPGSGSWAAAETPEPGVMIAP